MKFIHKVLDIKPTCHKMYLHECPPPQGRIYVVRLEGDPRGRKLEVFGKKLQNQSYPLNLSTFNKKQRQIMFRNCQINDKPKLPP